MFNIIKYLLVLRKATAGFISISPISSGSQLPTKNMVLYNIDTNCITAVR